MISIKRKGFTLVELMISVGIIGLIATIAIPAFYRSMMTARAAEAPLLLSAFSKAEATYFQKPRPDANGKELPSCYLGFYAPWVGFLDGTGRDFNTGLSGLGALPVKDHDNVAALGVGASTYVYFVYGTDSNPAPYGGGGGSDPMTTTYYFWYLVKPGLCSTSSDNMGIASDGFIFNLRATGDLNSDGIHSLYYIPMSIVRGLPKVGALVSFEEPYD